MKDFTRVAWVSEEARAYYAPRIQAAAAAWLHIEVEAVRRGYRAAALVFSKPADIESVEVAPGRFAVGPFAELLAKHYAAGNDDEVGKLLGFPTCCRKFFSETWGSGALDTTHQMSKHGTSGPIECNILGRWLGIRWVTHLPCSFNCRHTVAIGKMYRSLADAATAATIDEVLSWQAEWSALHGIAEVRFPVLKISTRTTYTAAEVKVQRQGAVPVGAPRGLGFPFSTVAKPLMVMSPEHSDNGFDSAETQERMHTMVLTALAERPPQGLTVDLGCGTGLLLQKVGQAFGVDTVGIESVSRKAKLRRNIAGNVADVETLITPAVDTFIVSARRLEETPALKAACGRARQCLVYSYDEPIYANFMGRI